MSDLRLAVFDCDGTLVDSQASIIACVSAAWIAEGLEPPARDDVLRGVGLRLGRGDRESGPGPSCGASWGG